MQLKFKGNRPKNMKDVVQPIPTFKLLRDSGDKIYKKFRIFPIKIYQDDKGIWGYRYKSFILLAKKELYGFILSCHEKAVLEAREHKIGIIIWIDSAKSFYWFDPYDIDKNNEPNTKGGVSMLNFSVKLGNKLDW